MLSPAQIRWLGVFLFATQVPQAPFVPMWVAGFGVMLIVLRLLFLHRDRARADAKPARIPSWALAFFAVAAGVAIRQSFGGVFLGARPVRRVPVRARRDQVSRSADDARRHAARLPRLLRDRDAVLLQPVAAGRVGCAAVPRGARHHAAGARRSPRSPTCLSPAWRQPFARAARLFVQGIPLAAVLFVLFPRLAGPLWGLPADAGRAYGSVRADGAGLDQRAVARRCGGVSRRVRQRHSAAGAALLARAGAGALRRPRMVGARAPRAACAASDGSHDRLLGHARAALEAVAPRARDAGAGSPPPTSTPARVRLPPPPSSPMISGRSRPPRSRSPCATGWSRRSGMRTRPRDRSTPRARKTCSCPRSAGAESEDDRVRARAAGGTRRRHRASCAPCSACSAQNRSTTRSRLRSIAVPIRSTPSCSRAVAASASTSRAPSSSCCARPASRRES